MSNRQTSQLELEALSAILAPVFLEYLRTNGTAVDRIEIATSLDGITSLPARMSLGGVEKNVLAPLSLLTKDVDAQINAASQAAAKANSAADNAEAAAKQVTDAITDISSEKAAAQAAAASANAAATNADNKRKELEASETQRQANEQARQAAEAARESAEALRRQNESARQTQEASRQVQTSASIERMQSAISLVYETLDSIKGIDSVHPIRSVPADMFVVAPKEVPAGAMPEIEVMMIPESADQSRIFTPGNSSSFVSPEGKIVVSADEGEIVVYVTSTRRSSLWKEVRINIRPLVHLQMESGDDFETESGTIIEI